MSTDDAKFCRLVFFFIFQMNSDLAEAGETGVGLGEADEALELADGDARRRHGGAAVALPQLAVGVDQVVGRVGRQHRLELARERDVPPGTPRPHGFQSVITRRRRPERSVVICFYRMSSGW